MPYKPNTILKRKEPFTEPENEPYNEIKIVSISPVTTGGSTAEWEGAQAEQWIIAPIADFGARVARPIGELQRDYEVVSEPENTGYAAAQAIPEPPARLVTSPEQRLREDEGATPDRPDKPAPRQATPLAT